MSLKMLHLSDIHFKCFKGNDYLDLDKDIQNEIERDLQELALKIGPIDVILLGGDIAFSGKDEEFRVAGEWISKLSTITGCKSENILMVPGNHDIDRAKISPMIKETQKAFKTLRRRKEIDSKLEEYLKSEASSLELLKPLDNYINFAQRFGAVPSRGNLLFWEKDFQLGALTIRIRGINSALISNETDDEHASKLLLGSHQSLIPRNTGVANIVLCHHPPDWLYDGDEVKRDLQARVAIHLFGHKHRFDSTRVHDSLVLSAGAMQPSRSEEDWEPRYNIIELDTLVNSTQKSLKVKVWKRVWDNGQLRKFIANFTESGLEFEEYELPVEKINSFGALGTNEIKDQITSSPTMIVEKSEIIEVIDVNTTNPVRKLVYMFLSLPYHKRLKVAFDLGLIDDSDKDLSEAQKSQAYFKRAQDKGQLKELWDLTSKLSVVKPEISNPF